MSDLRRLALPAAALAIAQVIHGATPGPETNEGGYVGLIGGLALLVASIAVAVMARGNNPAARPLAVITGVGVAGGFILYHALPWHSPVTNPYFGTDGIGIVQWTPVFLCIAAGVWLVMTARELAPAPSVAS
jgi:hypothetical protein